jgi:hypothetical protein
MLIISPGKCIFALLFLLFSSIACSGINHNSKPGYGIMIDARDVEPFLVVQWKETVETRGFSRIGRERPWGNWGYSQDYWKDFPSGKGSYIHVFLHYSKPVPPNNLIYVGAFIKNLYKGSYEPMKTEMDVLADVFYQLGLKSGRNPKVEMKKQAVSIPGLGE